MRLVVIAAIAFATLAACSLYHDDRCTYDGKRYERGAIFPAIDGCNTCSCTDQGVSCTLLACLPDAGPGACSGAACGGVICKAGERCVNNACLCGDHAACGDGDTCAAPGPVGGDSCGSICCGKSGPCPQ